MLFLLISRLYNLNKNTKKSHFPDVVVFTIVTTGKKDQKRKERMIKIHTLSPTS